jgi:hypothetical protein
MEAIWRDAQIMLQWKELEKCLFEQTAREQYLQVLGVFGTSVWLR